MSGGGVYLSNVRGGLVSESEARHLLEENTLRDRQEGINIHGGNEIALTPIWYTTDRCGEVKLVSNDENYKTFRAVKNDCQRILNRR